MMMSSRRRRNIVCVLLLLAILWLVYLNPKETSHAEVDSDGSVISDKKEGGEDFDHDSTPNYEDTDADGGAEAHVVNTGGGNGRGLDLAIAAGKSALVWYTRNAPPVRGTPEGERDPCEDPLLGITFRDPWKNPRDLSFSCGWLRYQEDNCKIPADWRLTWNKLQAEFQKSSVVFAEIDCGMFDPESYSLVSAPFPSPCANGYGVWDDDTIYSPFYLRTSTLCQSDDPFTPGNEGPHFRYFSKSTGKSGEQLKCDETGPHWQMCDESGSTVMSYDKLKTFVQETLMPACSNLNPEFCDDEEKPVLAKLQSMSTAQRLAIIDIASETIAKTNKDYESAKEKLDADYSAANEELQSMQQQAEHLQFINARATELLEAKITRLQVGWHPFNFNHQCTGSLGTDSVRDSVDQFLTRASETGRDAFVCFFRKGCSRSAAFKPIWDKIRHMMGGSSQAVLIGDVECDKYECQDLIEWSSTGGFPVLKYFTSVTGCEGKLFETGEWYVGYAELKTFILDNLGSKCSNINPELCKGAEKAQLKAFNGQLSEKWKSENQARIRDSVAEAAKFVEEAERVVHKVQNEFSQLKQSKFAAIERTQTTQLRLAKAWLAEQTTGVALGQTSLQDQHK